MLRKTYALALILSAAFLINASCSSDSTSPVVKYTKLSMTLTGLDSLTMERYEAWVVTQGQYSSLGKFNLNFRGDPIDDSGNIITEFPSSVSLDNASHITVTLEPNPDTDTLPSAIELLTADIVGDTLALAFQVDYSGRQGNVVMITPSDGGGRIFPPAGDPSNGFSGIWFVSKPWGEPEFGLNLLAPPSGWKYEGWYMSPAMKFISTGKFTNVSAKDETNAYFSNTDSAYVDSFWNFPGEDFLTNPPAGETFPLDVRGGMAFVTLEPDPDNSPMPFTPFTLFCKSLDSTMFSNLAYRQDTPQMPFGQVILK